ncbi:MAG: Ion-translocating oxidoreductase complex subunit E [Sodalis sp.]|nr:MAG: Ion-translocating oxidoreductase complex subunit E [Sodalis sp.]
MHLAFVNLLPIVTNCIVIGLTEAYASQCRRRWCAGRLAIELDSICTLLLLGTLRELLDNDTLFDGADQLLDGWARMPRIEVFYTNTPFLLIC